LQPLPAPQRKANVMTTATPTTQPPTPRVPYATWDPNRGCWETTQLDLFGRSERYWAIWPSSGWMRAGSAYRHHWPAHRITGSASSSAPIANIPFRTRLASDSSRGGETLDQVRARRGTIARSPQGIDVALHGPAGSPDRPVQSETLC